jgi:hypothetical protein
MRKGTILSIPEFSFQNAYISGTIAASYEFATWHNTYMHAHVASAYCIYFAASLRRLTTITYMYVQRIVLGFAHEQKAHGLQWVVSIGVVNKRSVCNTRGPCQTI